MSYSRWGFSSWYAFYNSCSGDTLDEQVLSLWYSFDELKDWSYTQLKDADKQWIIDNYGDISNDDIDQALEIIKLFKEDCEKDYS